jgi:hypothetical protein
MKKTKQILMMAALAGLASAGCFNRSHLSEHHARAYRQVFQRQAVNSPSAASSKIPKGLDALESTIVVDTYRKGLAPQGSAAATNQMILMSPNSGQLGYVPPAPPSAK